MENKRLPEKSVENKPKRFADGTMIHYLRVVDPYPTPARGWAYCLESPPEVLKSLAPTYRIRRYKCVESPFGEVSSDSAGLEIDVAEIPAGCTINGRVEDLKCFLSLPYQRNADQSTKTAKRKTQLKVEDLKKIFGKKVRRDYGPERYFTTEHEAEFRDLRAIRYWLDKDCHLWEELHHKPFKKEFDITNPKLSHQLEFVFESIQRKYTPSRWNGFYGKKEGFNFLDAETFRELVYHAVRSKRMTRKIGLDRMDVFIDEAIGEINNQFPRGYIEILGVVNGIEDPSFFDIRDTALERT